MTFDHQRYMLGTWGGFTDQPRRQVVAPGTRPLTQEQRAAARRQHRQAERTKELSKQGWMPSMEGWTFQGVNLSWVEIADLEDDALADLVKKRAEDLAAEQFKSQVAKYEAQTFMYGGARAGGRTELMKGLLPSGYQFLPVPETVAQGFQRLVIDPGHGHGITPITWTSTVTSSNPFLTGTLTT